MNTEQDDIMPTFVKFVIEGYNYQDTPAIYRDGRRVVPLQYSRDYRAMAYYFVIAAPDGPRSHQFILETYDYVKPTVTDGSTLKPVKVDLLRRRYGFNRWLLTV